MSWQAKKIGIVVEQKRNLGPYLEYLLREKPEHGSNINPSELPSNLDGANVWIIKRKVKWMRRTRSFICKNGAKRKKEGGLGHSKPRN